MFSVGTAFQLTQMGERDTSTTPSPYMAVGNDFIVELTNSRIEWLQKNGQAKVSMTLGEFFPSMRPLANPLNELPGGDPQAVYDPYNDRFIVLFHETQGHFTLTTADNFGRIDIAVSATSDPRGAWYRTTLDLETPETKTGHFADIPTLSVDRNAIYVTYNYNNFAEAPFGKTFDGRGLGVIEKGVGRGGFYDGGAAILHPFGTPPSVSPTRAQVTTSDGAATLFAGLLDQGGIELLRITRLTNALSAPSFSSIDVSLGDLFGAHSLPPIMQPNSTTTLIVPELDVTSVDVKDGLFFLTATLPGSGVNSGQQTVYWAEVDIANWPAARLLASGLIDGENLAVGTSTFLPSIAVNTRGDVAIVYQAAGPNLFAGAYVTAAAANDIGSLGAQSTALQVGLASFTYPVGHWGDSTTMVVDPKDGTTFWANASYIASPTAWGTVAAPVAIGIEAPTTVVTPLPISTPSGNPLIDAMLGSREVLSVPQAQRATTIGLTAYDWGGKVGAPVVLSYSFAAPGSSFAANYPTQYSSDIRTVPGSVQSAFEAALQAWSSVANVTFQRVQESGTTYGDIRIGVSASNTNFAPGQAGAESTPPASQNAALAGDVWLSPTAVAPGSWDWNAAGLGYLTAVHELGHAVFNLTDASTDRGLKGAILPAADNFRGETVMSYSVIPGLTTGQGAANQGSLSYWPTTPMVLDIQVAQWLYGANMSYHAGDDVYAFSQATTTYMTIWDGGGNDTISIFGNTRPGVIDLRPGAYSDVGSIIIAGTAAGSTQITKTLGIAYGATIENAIGGSGNDTLTGNDAANRLTGNGGNDAIDGGGGSDTAVYSGPAKNFVITALAGGSALTVLDRSGLDGTDTLISIEQVAFSTATVDAASFTKTASLTKAQVDNLTEVYIASFNRAPDALGLDYWGGRYKDGMSLDAIAKSFFAQPETTAKYPASTTNDSFVTTVYENVLGRAPDAEGLKYWSGELANGHVTRDSFLLAILNGAHANPGATADIANLNNKVAVGEHFALAKGLNSGTWSQQVMAGVTSAASTVTAANAMTDNFAAIAEAPATSELVVKILGIVA